MTRSGVKSSPLQYSLFKMKEYMKTVFEGQDMDVMYMEGRTYVSEPTLYQPNAIVTSLLQFFFSSNCPRIDELEFLSSTNGIS